MMIDYYPPSCIWTTSLQYNHGCKYCYKYYNCQAAVVESSVPYYDPSYKEFMRVMAENGLGSGLDED